MRKGPCAQFLGPLQRTEGLALAEGRLQRGAASRRWGGLFASNAKVVSGGEREPLLAHNSTSQPFAHTYSYAEDEVAAAAEASETAEPAESCSSQERSQK